ncbi:MAG: tagaturonate epimerase family protein [Chloroflexi bacterium]|nr:tagaturonate epimerase family protein [Chloroflexota bacterium]
MLTSLPGLALHPRSLAAADGAEFGLARTDAGARLAVLAPVGSPLLAEFEGETSEHAGQTLLLGPTSPQNAVALRGHLPWLRPGLLGLRTSAGLGDRLGLATPGHVAAVRSVGGRIAPIFAQQSIREMTRTGRTPQQVMDDATWGIFQEGWREGVGADADHLKTKADIDACLAAGFTFFTIDPGEYVDAAADTAVERTLRAKYAVLPWPDLVTTAAGLRNAYVGKRIEIEDRVLAFEEETLLRAAVKYGRAVAHVARMYRHLTDGRPPTTVELEVSVDETDTPTSHAEHVFIARELRRLGVRWVSLAPRYVGRFEKGVDYIGDLAEFTADFAGHAAIARALGPYKLSLHSGSDKFSIYPIAAEQTRGLVHLKTAGTSYLEALHTVAQLDPATFREIYVFARERYETDKVSYHVSAQLAVAPLPETVTDADLPALLDQFDAREILHVTFGSVLKERRGDGSSRFYDRLMGLLRANPEAYAVNLERHFIRHLRPFVRGA